MKKLQIFALSLMLSATAAFAHSDALKPEFVDTLVAPYLAIQKGLAEDDIKAAQTAAKEYLEAIDKAPHEGEAHKDTSKLAEPAKALTAASDIKAARTAFLSLSQEVISLVEHIGTNKDTPLYIVHCPMAFDNKGGGWLQADKTVSNPYYGSMMLRCGSIKNQIVEMQLDTDSTKENPSHSH
jgi:Cu(I)/Ag(I) efflux system membrane fusion protein